MTSRSVAGAAIRGLAAFALAVVPLGLSARADTLTPAEETVVAQAITILRDYDKCCKTAAPPGFDQGISVADCLTAIALSGNFCSKNLGERAYGGKTLDDKTANCADKDIIILASRMLDSGKKGSDFIDLLATMFHEGTHALQDLSAVTTSNYFDKVTGPLEVQAWGNEKLFLEKFKAALQKVLQNIVDGNPPGDGLDDCQRKLMACYTSDTTQAQLEEMIRSACAAIALETKTIDDITAWLTRVCPPAPPAEGAPRDSEARSEDGSHRAGSGPGNSCVKKTEDPGSGTSIHESDIDTTLDEIFGLAFQQDDLGVDYLIVAGHRGGNGFVQLWCDPTPGVPDDFVFAGEIPLSPFSSAPSGLIPVPPSGPAPATLLLWDEIQGDMFAMVDNDADGVVDAFDPTPRYGLPIDPTGFRRLEVAGPGEYRLVQPAIGSMTADLPEIRITDLDADGFFEPTQDLFGMLRPQQDPQRAPNLCSRPFEFSTRFVAIGAPGHQLALAQTDPAGNPLGPYAPPTLVGPDNVAVFNLNPPGFLPGTFTRIFDLNNGLASAVYQILPPAPVVYTAQNNVGPGSGGTIVTQFGENLDLLGITGVLVGGIPAPILALDPLGVTYMTPPNPPVPADGISDHGLVLHVQMVMGGGARFGGAFFDAQPFAYLDPILEPQYECRKGNVNAAAGPVANVLFINGSPGIGNARRVFVTPTDPIAFTVARPPSKTSGTSRCCIYVWAGEGGPGTVSAQPFGLGSTCRATPLNRGVPGQPKRIANSIGFPAQLGAEDWPGPPTSPAPTTLLNLGAGLGRTGRFLFQGFIIDTAAPNGQAATTNAVILVSE